MTINQRIQAAAGYLGRAAAGTAGGVLLATYTVNENSWLRWELDSIKELYSASCDQNHRLDKTIHPLRVQCAQLEAAVSRLQADSARVEKQLAFERKIRRASQAGRARQCADLKQQLSHVWEELAASTVREWARSAELQRLQREHEDTITSIQASTTVLPADKTALQDREMCLGRELDSLNRIIAAMKEQQAAAKQHPLETTAATRAAQVHLPDSAGSNKAISKTLSHAALQDAVQHLQFPLAQADANGAQNSIDVHVNSSLMQCNGDELGVAQHAAIGLPTLSNVLTEKESLQALLQPSAHSAADHDHDQMRQQLQSLQSRYLQLQTACTTAERDHSEVLQQLAQLKSQQAQQTQQEQQAQQAQQADHTAALDRHSQLSVAQAARIEALIKQHAEFQADHTQNEAELWELADAHAELNTLHDASLEELADQRVQLAKLNTFHDASRQELAQHRRHVATLQKAVKTLQCDRAYMHAHLCSTATELQSARQDTSAVAIDLQRSQNELICVKSQREAACAMLESLQMDQTLRRLGLPENRVMAEAEEKCRAAPAMPSLAELDKDGVEVQAPKRALEQRLRDTLALQKPASSGRDTSAGEDLIKAVALKPEQRHLGRTDSALDDPSPRRRC